MGYQIKLQLLDKPKQQLTPAEQKAIELAAHDWATFLEATLKINTPRRSGKLFASIRKLVFGKKGSAKVYYDITAAPHAAEVMRGVKSDRIITARGKALKFTGRSGETLYRKQITKRKSFGLRIPEKMRNNMQVHQRLKDILISWLNTQMTGKVTALDLSPVLVG